MDNSRYTTTQGRVYVSGVQALVRLMVMQRLRDQAAGIDTAGFGSGYRGSPLGGLDQAFTQAGDALSQHAIHFRPGVNEELAATAVWGTQQVQLIGESNVEGVFALWYGKGPGVDRSVDVLKHMNYAGTSAKGGVLLVAGDDHGAYSSTLAHQSDHVFSAAMIPVLYPCNVAEYNELGLHGWALSRYSGCVVGFKALADTVESSASIDADPFAVEIRIPEDHGLPEGGLNCRASSAPLGVQARAQELLMHQHKYFAVLAANLGDGTYFHSGYLAIRAAVAANVNITYKILYNDAVAMTGGQPVDGPITVPAMTRQLAAEGGTLRKGDARAALADRRETVALPEPVLPVASAQPFNILVCGIGGTGVITIGALLGTAAHLEGKDVSVLDMTGMSQKNGSVTCHIRIADRAGALHAQRIPSAQVDLLLGCDMLTAAAPDAVDKLCRNRTFVLLNTHEQHPGHAIRTSEWQFPRREIEQLLRDATGDAVDMVEATALATQSLGDEMAANMIMLGFAYQRGRVPLGEVSLMRAIELNGVAVTSSKAAFLLGRQTAAGELARHVTTTAEQAVTFLKRVSLDELIEQRREFLQDYQDARYASRYLAFVDRVRQAERMAFDGQGLTRAVAENLFRLMSYKDEYEVARLFVDKAFRKSLDETFEGNFKVHYHLAPPVLSFNRHGAAAVKRTFGPWIVGAFRLLAACRTIRGTRWDVFGYTGERKQERALISEYVNGIEQVMARLDSKTYPFALRLARLPEQIRGYGHIKAASIEKTWMQWRALLSEATGHAVRDVANDDRFEHPADAEIDERCAS